MRRVVVTGLGMVTPFGVGVDYNWKNLIAGKSAIREIDTFDVSDVSAKIAGLIPRGGNEPHLFNPDDVLSPKDQRKVCDFILYALKAAEEAILDSNWNPQTEEERFRSGVNVGSGIGGLQPINTNSLILDQSGPKRISPFFIPSSLINLASGHISIKYGLKGPNHSVVSACATGTHAIGDAFRFIKYGDADLMVTGGAESAVTKLGLSGFAAARALSTSYNETPEKASRPWDEGRDGFVMGEGAGVLVLEEYEHAKRRGAKIYAEVCGYGLSGDAHHITAPDSSGSGAYRAMEGALKDANMSTNDIDYINAHGTSTPLGDKIELETVKRLFTNKKSSLSMSSTKSAIGHLLGAAGSVEAIYSILAIRDSIRPATINLENPLAEAEGFNLIPNVAQQEKTEVILSNSFGFGGTNASIIMKKI